MAKFQNTRREVSGLNIVVVDNNPISVISCLRSNGVIVSDTSRNALIDKLENLFDTNKPQWVSVIKCITYDPNVNNYTTNAELRQMLADTYASQYGTNASSKIDFSSILTGIGDFIGGSSTTSGGGTITETKPVISQGAAIAITVIGIIIVAVIAFRK